MFIFVLLGLLLVVFACYNPPNPKQKEHMISTLSPSSFLDPDLVMDCSVPKIRWSITDFKEEPLPPSNYASLLIAVTVSLDQDGLLLNIRPHSTDRIVIKNHPRLDGFYYMQVIASDHLVMTNAIMTDVDLENHPNYAPRKVALVSDSELLRDLREDQVEMQNVDLKTMQTDHTIELHDRIYIKSIKRIGIITKINKKLGVCTITLEEAKERLPSYCLNNYDLKTRQACEEKNYTWHTPCMHDTECSMNLFCLNGFCK